jgi:queuine tRNA-ribosyltransferase
LRYLLFSRDPLAETLLTIHNLTFYQDLMKDIRAAIEQGRFGEFEEEWLGVYKKAGHRSSDIENRISRE